ncbi:EAL domain-containing protein [Glaciecola petra]|uniref:EAL domain-containing protein n=1 Tax=Glaciecola petra TaxID=3075602 RepID=A0ABU2ZTV4_9ALTE|nr:EAL domain-containing protein [Aestuariibacter sp. P117]MDT0595691.1 EAL domain-containing protein [Aestuariibacter sp. P117]
MQNEAIDINFEEAKNVNEYAQFHVTNEGLLLSDVQQLTRWLSYTDFESMPLHDALWMRFDIENASTSNRALVLVAGSVFVDNVDAFLLDSQSRIVQSGRLQNAQANGTNISRKGFKMDFVSRAESRYTIYVRIKDDGNAIIPIELWHAEAHSKESGVRLILLGAMSGGLALLATYFLLTYILRNAAARFWFCVLATASMTTIMSAEGILPSVFLLPSMTAELTSFGLLVSLFASIKITKFLLEPMPTIWLRAHYLLLLVPFISIFVLNDFYQLIILLVLAIIFFFSNLLASLLYRYSVDLRSVIIYFTGWMALGIVGLLESLTFASSASHLSFTQPYVYAFTCLGVMLIGVSIISREQSVQAKTSFQQGQQIAQLQQYNDLFQHAAEGLYTALPNGQLIHVNPAICSLFGYTDNDSFLSTNPNLSVFFANPKDVDLLLGELSIQQTVLGKEVKGKRTDGGEFWFSISCQIKRVNEKTLHFGSLFDITERRLHQINLQYLNTHDQLTGLFNRRHFLQIMNERIQSHNLDSEKFALLFLDVDQFKVINDTCGHSAGDIFIKELSHELFDVIDETNPFSRLSADQFALLVNYKNSNELRKLASNILSKVRKFQFKWDRHVFTQSMSIGIAPFDQHIPSGEELLSYADTACLIAKEGGRDQIHIYSAEIGMHSSYKRELYWVNEVNKALKDENLALFYQHYRPLNSNDSKEYYEILVRLRTEDNDFVAPEFFMPSAEKAHISHKIDKQVVETYFKWLNTHNEYLKNLGKANINLSGPSLSDDDFKFFLLNAFEKYAIPHEKICFEITETMAIIKMNDAIDFMHEFKKLGCTFALDDFGSGFSSYNYLKNLPVDFVKIDGNFIRDILHDPIDLAMVTSIRDVADAMKIKTVAEFVESPEIMVQIGKLGVDFAQGFCIAKPEPLTNYLPFAESQKH